MGFAVTSETRLLSYVLGQVSCRHALDRIQSSAIHAAQGEGRLSVASRAGQEEKDGQDAKEKEENGAARKDDARKDDGRGR